MRHVFLAGPIPTRPGGVMKTPGTAGLVTARGSAQTLLAGTLRALGRAIALTPVTAAAQQDGAAAART